MSGKIFWLCLGLAGGVVLSVAVRSAMEEPEPVVRSEASRRATAERVADLSAERDRFAQELVKVREERADLATQVEELGRRLEAAEAAAKPAPAEQTPAKPTGAAIPDEEIKAEIRAFAPAIRSIILGDEAGDAVARLREFLARGGEPVRGKLAAMFHDDEEEIGLRTVVAYALAHSGEPASIKVLTEALEDPASGMLEHRFASHALAFSDHEGIEAVLSRVANDEAKDIGARANSAFGLARRGLDEGYELYMSMTDTAIEKGDPAGLQYLGGVTLLESHKVLPYLRARLTKYKEPQALLLVIEVLKSRGDKAAVPELEKLAFDSSRPASVQRAAEAAIKALQERP